MSEAVCNVVVRRLFDAGATMADEPTLTCPTDEEARELADDWGRMQRYMKRGDWTDRP